MSALAQLGLRLRRTDASGARRYTRPKRALASEHQMQAAIAERLRIVIGPEGHRSPCGVIWWSCDHANAHSAATGAERKKRGVIAAQSDLVFAYDPGQVLWVELKTIDGELSRTRVHRNKRGELVETIGQVEFHRDLRAIHHHVEVVRDWSELVLQLRAHGVPMTRRIAA